MAHEGSTIYVRFQYPLHDERSVTVLQGASRHGLPDLELVPLSAA